MLTFWRRPKDWQEATQNSRSARPARLRLTSLCMKSAQIPVFINSNSPFNRFILCQTDSWQWTIVRQSAETSGSFWSKTRNGLMLNFLHRLKKLFRGTGRFWDALKSRAKMQLFIIVCRLVQKCRFDVETERLDLNHLQPPRCPAPQNGRTADFGRS